MAEYQRARSAEHKQERMDAIMEAADELFTRHPYHEITMGAIAEKLGWSRSNLYKYAATQEEIFLALHSAKNRAWIDELASALEGAPLPVDEFARLWAEVTDRHAAFLRYQEIIISIIESNVTLERLTEFKRTFKQVVDPIVAVLEKQCTASQADATELYLTLLFQAPGLYNHYHSAELTREAMRAAGFPPTTGTFAEGYARFVAMCVERYSA